MKSNKLQLDKSTLARLQAKQLQAISGGTDYESNVVTVGVDDAPTQDGGDRTISEADSCCSKSCRRK